MTRTGSVRRTSVFTIPEQSADRDCNGTITAIQYCYDARNFRVGRTVNVFNLLLLTRNTRRLLFDVDSSLSLYTTLREDICTATSSSRSACCDTFEIQSIDEQIQLTSSSLLYAITNRNDDLRPTV